MKQQIGYVCLFAVLACFYVNAEEKSARGDKKLSQLLSLHSSLTKREVREPPLEHDYEKRNWQKASGMWGKRSDGSSFEPSFWSKRGWEKGSGLWGKRGDSWTKASGMWGKRALNEYLDSSAEMNGYGKYKKKFANIRCENERRVAKPQAL